MRKIKYLSALIISLLLTLINHAQTDKAEMADTMRSNGRIYVVVAVVVLILLGLFLYLVRLDKKITRVEKNNSLSDESFSECPKTTGNSRTKQIKLFKPFKNQYHAREAL